MQELTLLKEYQKDLDFDRAMKDAGFKRTSKQSLTNINTKRGQAILAEMEKIQRAWMKAMDLNPVMAAAKHIELMGKIEKDYDLTPTDSKNKPGMASALLKGSDTSLKATNHFASERAHTGVTVEINIDLGEHNQPIDITPDVEDEDEES